MKKNVLIIYNNMLHYRKPFLNRFDERYNITVLHSGKNIKTEKDTFNELITPIWSIGPLKFQKGVLKAVNSSEYDIIIALFDVAWLNTLIAFFLFSKHKKIILWGAWITQNKLANAVRAYFTKRAFANVFYTNEAQQDFIEMGLPKSNLYVGNNTFDVEVPQHSYEHSDKFRILFVGSFDKRKENSILIGAFESIKDKIPDNILLTFVGDGEELTKIKSIVSQKDLSQRVSFVGRLNDNDSLRAYYKEAIVSVSFGQAGLSVLQALGNGVPFLTKRNAISGGEISNLVHKYNGLICEDSKESLAAALMDLCNNIDWAKTLGKNAINYYQKYCTMDNMVNGFVDAIEGTKTAIIDTENRNKNE